MIYNWAISELKEAIEDTKELIEEYENLFEWERIAQRVFNYPERRIRTWDQIEAEEQYEPQKQFLKDLKSSYKELTGEDYDTRRME